jgi:hypothetical protein
MPDEPTVANGHGGQALAVVEKAAIPAAKGDDFAALGSTAVRHSSGTLAEDYLPGLRGPRGVKAIGDMLDDPIIGGSMMAIDKLLGQVEWVWEPRDDSAEARRWADFAATCAEDMSASWADTLTTIGSFRPYGWAYCAIGYKRRLGEQPDDPSNPDALPSSDYDDGLVGWRRIELRPQESLDRWAFDADGWLRGMWQRQDAKPSVLIPLEQALLFRSLSYTDSPQGRSVLRSAYTPWWDKRRIRELELIGIERDLAGLPMAGVPPRILSSQSTSEDRLKLQAFQQVVTGVRRNAQEGLIWPLEYDENGNKIYTFDLLGTGSRRQIDISEVIARKNAEMAISVLTDWLLLGHEQTGSRAVAGTKVDVFTAALDAWSRSTAGVFNAHGTPRLMAMNGAPKRLAPKLRPANVEKVDIAEFASSISSLLTAGGLTPDATLEDRIRDVLGLPPRQDASAA